MMTERSPLRAIGIRATPKRVYYAVVQAGTHLELLTKAFVVIPPALEVPAQLHFMRTTILDIIAEYGVHRAGIRLTEPSAPNRSIARLNMEGVIQELLCSSAVGAYFAGPIATIAARLGEHRPGVSGYFDGAPFREMDDWSQLSREKRESIVTAVAATSLPDFDV